MAKLKSIFSIAIAFIMFSSAGAWAENPVAGVKPDQRPEGAPQVTEVAKDQNWYKNALRGVSEPYRNSLKFLEDQGNWYTPFSRRGMPGPYDIRGLHSQ